MRCRAIVIAAGVALVSAGCADDDPATQSAPPTAPTTQQPSDDRPAGHDGEIDPELLAPAYLGAAPFQDVEVAEASGWVNTIDALGCFEQPGTGGMGVHWLNESLLDDVVDPARPEALVYELDADGAVAGLVGHEYLVPLDAWTSDDPPSLFGMDFHPHPVLPFWILHAYLWKDNPAGMFADWNPAVRPCPDGVPIFGEDQATDDGTGDMSDESAGDTTDESATHGSSSPNTGAA